METRKLEHYGGQGYGYSDEFGRFVIKWGEDGSVKKEYFGNLQAAIKRFKELKNEERFLWDITTMPELIDAYHWVDI